MAFPFGLAYFLSARRTLMSGSGVAEPTPMGTAWRLVGTRALH